ncbi:hypothetical protein H0H81_000956 [Sphagnurus paluster]|uniref:PNPLA domain-containing protein n=1 Tax=Sphagnurus paluster TaxID=117069 RepID=A0A9P7FMU2_9AGAR|nr:hypothetical protein H0H81_000956 [Sphagnurus paluster]
MQKQRGNPYQRGLRLLALDNGGILGLSELLIIKEIMHRVQSIADLPSIPRPCDYFDLIGGVGTGGIIVLMLGRLQMPIDQAIQEYVTLTKRVFSQKKLGCSNQVFKATQLVSAIRHVIESAGLSSDILMRVEDQPHCFTFVAAIPAVSMGQPRLFRSYKVEANQSFNCTVVEAVRATTAAPEFFKPIYIGDLELKEQLLGASLGWGNPVELVLDEAESVFPLHHVACIISLGSGHPGPIALQFSGLRRKVPALVDVLQKISTSCEDTAERMEKKFKHATEIYSRMSVEQGHQKISFKDWKRLPEIKTHTLQYLQLSNTIQKVKSIAEVLHKCPKTTSIKELNGPVLLKTVAILEASHNIPPPTSVFTGRQDILNSLDKYFDSEKSSVHLKKQRRSVLYGLGGAGKTQIILKFIQDFRAKFSNIYWINSATKEGIESTLTGIAQRERLEETTPDDCLEWLCHQKKEWLIVFDNADDPILNLTVHMEIFLLQQETKNAKYWLQKATMQFMKWLLQMQ